MVLAAIKKRRSVREFSPKKVPEKAILEIIKAGQFAPSGKHNGAVEFIIIKTEQMRAKLAEYLQQPFISQAPLVIAPVTDTSKSRWICQDLSVASENMFLQAAELGLGTVWKNVSEEQCEEVKRILGLPPHFTLINMIPVGYPKEKAEPHPDSEFSKKKIHREKW
ncbi:MAG: nitroreductase family protein [Candidatus Micrarchaeota archaeon]